MCCCDGLARVRRDEVAEPIAENRVHGGNLAKVAGPVERVASQGCRLEVRSGRGDDEGGGVGRHGHAIDERKHVVGAGQGPRRQTRPNPWLVEAPRRCTPSLGS